MRESTVGALLAVALLSGCEADEVSKGTDAGTKVDPPKCAELIVPGKQVDIDTQGSSQLQAVAAFDGALWVAYAQVDQDGSSGFDIWATRLACDGSVLTPPFRVNTATGTNDLDPAIAVGNGRVLIAWMTDSGQFPNNLTVRYRVYASDGTAITSDEAKLQTTLNGSAVDANMWEHAAAAVPQGFAVAGTRAPLESSGGFRTFVQRLDADGNPVGETIDAHQEQGIRHQNAALSATLDGSLFVAWGRSQDSNDLVPVQARILPSATTMLPDPPVEVLSGRVGDYPTMATDAAGHVFATFSAPADTGSTILVKEITAFNPDAASLEFLANRANSYGPRLAGGESGGAVAWLVQPSSGRSLAVRRFDYDGQSFTRGPLRSITGRGGEVMPQIPGLAHVAGHIYFATWSERTATSYVLQGQFVVLEDE